MQSHYSQQWPSFNTQIPHMYQTQAASTHNPFNSQDYLQPYQQQQYKLPANKTKPVPSVAAEINQINEFIEYESFSEDEESQNHNKNNNPWQEVAKITKKRKRNTTKNSKELSQHIDVSNRFQPLATVDQNENDNNINDNKQTKEPKPPPIYIHGVKDYKGMVQKLTDITEAETYHTRATANNTVKVNPHSPETYRKLVRYLREENIIHHTYQLKQERAYRIVIRDLHHSIPPDEIKNELESKGHKVRNIINVRHRTSKEPLPLFFVDLEPCENNKTIYELQYLGHCKIRVEPPRKKNYIIQCTRCQEYGHSKAYCTKPFNCVKCGKSHDSKICKKPRDTPATCALCNGDHPANYKGCSVYRDLLNLRQQRNKTAQIRPLQQSQANTNTNQQQRAVPSNYHNTAVSYAQVVSHTGNHTASSSLEDKLESFLTEFKNMFCQLINQNSMILSMLTTVINKVAN